MLAAYSHRQMEGLSSFSSREIFIGIHPLWLIHTFPSLPYFEMPQLTHPLMCTKSPLLMVSSFPSSALVSVNVSHALGRREEACNHPAPPFSAVLEAVISIEVEDRESKRFIFQKQVGTVLAG
eukprot:Polyplicarium_translucidae@DN3388_c4_g1_i2.p3